MSGTTTPISIEEFVRNERAWMLGSKPRSSAASLTRCRVASVILGWFVRARLAVDVDTFAAAATSASVARRAAHLGPAVVSEGIVACSGYHDGNARVGVQHDGRRVDVVVLAEALPVANGAYGEHLGNLVAGQPAGEIEVVHVHVPEDAAARG